MNQNPRALQTRLSAAAAVARDAGTLMRRRYQQRDRQPLEFKGAHDYFTETDQEVETLIVERLGGLFPEDAFLGEEGGGEPGSMTWVIDPIDGTENFARGIPRFCTSIAFVQEGKPTLGVLYDPLADELYCGASGQGATLNGVPMRVSAVTALGSALVEVGFSSRLPMAGFHALAQRVTATGASLRRAGSGALGLADVAAGRIEGYVELHINAWDCLAGIVLVQEAGGWCNDFLAGEGLLKGNPILATTPALQKALQAAAQM